MIIDLKCLKDEPVDYYEKVASDTVIGCVYLQDRDRRVLKKVELSAIGDRLSAILESRYSLCGPYEFSGALVGLQQNQLPKSLPN